MTRDLGRRKGIRVGVGGVNKGDGLEDLAPCLLAVDLRHVLIHHSR